MTKTEKAVRQMEAWANDDSHGYDQTYRWGERGDYDCSSAIIQVWENAGVPVKSKGASYTGNMYRVFLACGFQNVTAEIDLASGKGLRRGDVLLGLSTSGNSQNVINAVKVAKAAGLRSIGLGGQGGGKLRELSDVYVALPKSETYLVQELTLPVYHAWCRMLEWAFWGKKA